MLCVCVVDVMDVVFSVCNVRRGAVGARVYVSVLGGSCGMTFRLLMLIEDGRGILQRWSHKCLIGCHKCLLLFTPSCCSECFYDL